jgi:hypothetical protein
MNPCPKEESDDAPFKDMCEHSCYVWDEYVKESGFEKVFIMAFAAGGDCLISIQKAFPDTFYEQV